MKKAIIVFGALLILTFTASHSFADDTMIHGCIRMYPKILRVVSKPDQCRSYEIPISWNQMGQPGEDGYDGLSFWDTNDDGFKDAAEDINADGLWNSLDCQGSMAMTPQSLPPENPALGDMYYNDSEAICVYMSAGWVKIAGDGLCEPDCSDDGRFCDNGDGTISDTISGLMWAASSSTVNTNWAVADTYCTTYTGGGHTDWRQPTIAELQALYDAGVRDHNQHDFIKVDSYNVWSSETSGSFAADFHFNRGYEHWHFQALSYYERALPVRSGN